MPSPSEMLEEEIRLRYRYYVRVAAGIAGPQYAEDAAQDAFLLAYKGIGQFRSDAPMAGWLAAITRNASFSVLRREKLRAHRSMGDITESEIPRVAPVAHKRIEQSETRAELRSAIATLNPSRRSAIDLFLDRNAPVGDNAFRLRKLYAIRNLRKIMTGRRTRYGIPCAGGQSQ